MNNSISFELLENSVRRKIIKEFFRTEIIVNFADIKTLVEKDSSRPDYHLNLLIEGNFIKRTKGRGNYRLNEKVIQPLRNYLDKKVPLCLVGGLGVNISLYVDVLDALRKISILPIKYVLITSKEIKEQFEKLAIKADYPIENSIKILDFQTTLKENYLEIKKLLEDIVCDEIYRYNIICELTGSTKLVSIALMDLGEKYNLQRIYFSGKKILWV